MGAQTDQIELLDVGALCGILGPRTNDLIRRLTGLFNTGFLLHVLIDLILTAYQASNVTMIEDKK